MVFQHPYLFDGPILDNVRAGHPDADDKDVRNAMALARVDEIVSRLPDGESTRVGEAGAALSGGERQRVSIARALVKPAGVLLIDEATSALDTENETAITDAIRDDPRGRTRVIIAHRPGAIRHADQVLFVDDGKIVEQGSIEELTRRGRPFRRVLAAAGAERRLADRLARLSARDLRSATAARRLRGISRSTYPRRRQGSLDAVPHEGDVPASGYTAKVGHKLCCPSSLTST